MKKIIFVVFSIFLFVTSMALHAKHKHHTPKKHKNQQVNNQQFLKQNLIGATYTS